jgi:IS605 OrfB family transposase
MMPLSMFTYQTRLELDSGAAAALQSYAEQAGMVERRLFAALMKNQRLSNAGRKAEVLLITALKSTFIAQYGITARHFNAIRMVLEGKIKSIQELNGNHILDAEARLKRAEKTLIKLRNLLHETQHPKVTKKAPAKPPLSPAERQAKIAKLSLSIHHKERNLPRQQAKLLRLRTDQKAGVVRMCFGSKKLFREQFNAPDRHDPLVREQWKNDWQASRSNQFFLVGSKDETAGCQSCVATVQADGRLTLRIRLPDALGKHQVLTDVHFAYGHAAVLASLQAQRALSYRFVRDAKGWRVFLSTEHDDVDLKTRHALGAIGLDLNVNHVALAEVDRFGNLIRADKLPCHNHGKSTDQAKALIGDLAKAVAARCAAAGKPLVLERLDFQARKKALEEHHPRAARMLSGFYYSKMGSALRSACFRLGVEVLDVNPAYTSTIGAINHAQPRGISVHQGAAMAIARRGMGFSERLSTRIGLAPARRGGHVTFDLPARNRSKHVWSFWADSRKNLQAALAAHFRSGASKDAPAPLISPFRYVATRRGLAQSACSTRRLPENPRHARHSHCSGAGLEIDVPF